MFTVGIAPVFAIAPAVQSDGTTRADKIAIPDPDCFSANLPSNWPRFWPSRTTIFAFLKISREGGETSVVDAPSPSSKYTSRAPNARPTGDAKTPLAPLLKSYRTSSLTARARALSISAVSGADTVNRGQRFFEEAAFFFGFPAKKPDAWRVARRARADHRATPRADTAGVRSKHAIAIVHRRSGARRSVVVTARRSDFTVPERMLSLDDVRRRRSPLPES